MKALLTLLRNHRGEFIAFLLVAGTVLAGGAIGKWMYGRAKKSEGRAVERNIQLEAKNAEKVQITKEKNEYLLIQAPKRRRYEEAVKKEDNAKERAEATFDLFERTRK